ncbi:pisatin demethylase [Stipitochalara longipes BDJ]|nr:pisatin demethylase [Stipitochalara longipes BDJ]
MFAIVAQGFHSWYRLRAFKGPFLASFSDLWLIRHTAGGTIHLDLFDITEKYGPIARVGSNTLVTSDPNLLRRMSSVRSSYKRSDWFYGMRFDPSRDNILSHREDEKHNLLRAKMAAGYSGKEVQNLEKLIDQNVLALVDLLERKYISTKTDFKPVDFGRTASYFTLDTLSSIAFGEPFGDLATDSDVHNYIETTEESLPVIILVTVIPWLSKLLQMNFMKRFLPSEKDKIGLGRMIGVAKEVVGKRFGLNKESKNDMLGSFINHGLTQEEAESESLVQIMAGSDTTATAIRATMLHVLTSPQVVSALLAEITEVSPSSPIKDAEARKMPYLQAVIQEGLRIFPPVTGLLSKSAPLGGDTFNGLFIPEGTKIGYCAWGVSRDKTIWGDDSHVFRPERWLDCSPKELRNMEATLELVFGYGRWQCLGRNVALIELNKVFVELLRHFDMSLVEPLKPWKSFCAGIFLQNEMWMRITKRQKVL